MPYDPKRKVIYPESEKVWWQGDSAQDRLERKALLNYEWATLVTDAWGYKPGPGARPGTRPGSWTGETIKFVRPGVPKELAMQIRLGFREYRDWAKKFQDKTQTMTGAFQEELHAKMQEYHHLRSTLEPIAENEGRVLQSTSARVIAKVPRKGLGAAVSVAQKKVKEAVKAAGTAAGAVAKSAFESALPFLLVAGIFWLWTQKPPPTPEPEKLT